MIEVKYGEQTSSIAIGDIDAGSYFSGAIGDATTPNLWFRGGLVRGESTVIAWSLTDGASVGMRFTFDRGVAVLRYRPRDVKITVKA